MHGVDGKAQVLCIRGIIDVKRVAMRVAPRGRGM